MIVEYELLTQMEKDLGLYHPFVRGQVSPVRNCWHFSTDGNAVDSLFRDDEDFAAAMNRIYVVSRSYRIVILAFALMDTHVHFVLYGELSHCRFFMHDYIKRTSMFIARKYSEKHKLDNVPINHQTVDSDLYLKTVICYVIKNPPVGGVPFMAWNYPWSSGALYFCCGGKWNSPFWTDGSSLITLKDISGNSRRKILSTREISELGDVKMAGNIIFPGEYVAYEVVEKLYKTCKSYNYFLCISREEDVESRGGSISHLTIPMQEMRQHKSEVCLELFGVETVKTLSTVQRLRLARELRKRYNSSLKQIARLCGLVYEEVRRAL